MVNEAITIRDKHRGLKKFTKWFLIILVIVLVLLIVFLIGMLKGEKVEVVLENPIAGIVSANTNEGGEVEVEKVVEQAVIEFDEDYINYILVALGTGYLHKNPLTFENPFIEFDLEGEIWSSEIIKGVPNSQKIQIDDEDLRITISKEEAVRSLLAENIEQFMKESVSNGNTEIQMISGKTELFAKGYLDMYKDLTGEEIVVEE